MLPTRDGRPAIKALWLLRRRLWRCLAPLIMLNTALHAQYTAQRSGEAVQLTDRRHDMVVSIDPSGGDQVFRLVVKGQDILHFPYASLEEFRRYGGSAGIPFLAPWANRLDEQAFYANGKKYSFNMSLGNVRGTTPIHGFLMKVPWDVVEMKADKDAAWLTCRLEFYRHPDWMAQFPFAQTYEITQRLHDGVLEVHTTIHNLSTEPLPVSIGFHPYFQLTDSKREDWTISVGAGTHYPLGTNRIPTGTTEPITNLIPNPKSAPLKPLNLDDVFGDLDRDDQGKAEFSVTGKHQKLVVQFGPRFHNVVIFSPDPSRSPPPRPPQDANAAPTPPPDRNFICFEPMSTITDALNLEHAGKFTGLQSIPPGGIWEESFWVRPSGF